jgi:succinate-semialdehyde dehydrogenase/glutarate-semialdehyde dehydrogenase
MADTTYPDIQLLIDGAWVEGTDPGRVSVSNPSTGQTLTEFAGASDGDVRAAIAAAKAAFPAWSGLAPRARAVIMHRAAALVRDRIDRLAMLMALELGKPLAEGRGEAGKVAEHLEWHAEQGMRVLGDVIPAQAGIVQTARRFPVGPVAAFAPWNGPGASPARKISAAIASGCTLVMKPAEETPATAMAIAECLVDAGLPKGVLNIVYGNPVTISQTLLESRDIRMISFTGSVPVGRHLATEAGKYLKPMILELGGHAPVIVCEDADPIATADLAVGAKFRNSGQICVSPTRFFVHESLHERFVDRLVERTEALVVGDPLDPATTMGPVVHDRRLEAVDTLIQQAISVGAELRTGGKRLHDTGSFYAPTILDNVPDAADIMQHEPFGPVIVIQRFTDLDEVIDRANGTDFGLAAYAFTGNALAAETIASRIETGIMSINHFAGSNVDVPFGGVKDSGYGREGGAQCFDGYLTIKSVSHKIA